MYSQLVKILVDTFPVCQMMMTPLKTPCSSHVNDPLRMIEVTTWVLICWPFISRSWHCTNWYKTPCILVQNKLWHFFNPTNYLNMYINYWINNSYKTLYYDTSIRQAVHILSCTNCPMSLPSDFSMLILFADTSH